MKRITGPEFRYARLQFFMGKRLDFYRQMVSLLRAGVSKVDAVELIWRVESFDGRKPKEALAILMAECLYHMRNGDGFGRALRHVVPRDDVMIIDAMESADDFASLLEGYCVMLEKKKRIRWEIFGGLAYPAVLVSAIYAMAVYFGSTVIPEISLVLPAERWTGPAVFLRFLGDFAAGPALWFAALLLGVIAVSILSMPRWTGAGRAYADRLPLFQLYRVYTGLNFLMSVAALGRAGLPVSDAIERLRPRANAYVGTRLLKIKRSMLDGRNLGEALVEVGDGWPDPRINLTIKVFAETQDLNRQIGRIAEGWIDTTLHQVRLKMVSFRILALFAVAFTLGGIIGGMYGLIAQMSETLTTFN